MFKHLRTLLLIATLCVPWVTQAQDCTPISTFPVTYGFEASEGFTTTVTAAAACTTNVFNNCWRNEQTSFNGTTGSGRIWHIYGGTTATYLHSGAHSLMLPDKGSTTAGVSTTMLTFPAMTFTNPGGYIVTFWIQRNGTSTNPEGFKIYVSDTDTIGPNAVELGHYSRNHGIAYPCIESATGWYQYETAPITMTGIVYIIFEGQSYYGSSTYVDDITIMETPTCFKVSDLAVNASQTTTNSLTLTWNDTINSGATYSIYSFTATDTTLVQSGVTGTTYTVSGLNAATLYTFAVVTDCGDGDTSMYSSIVSAYTACAALTADDLPYSYGFDDLATGSSTVRPTIPCWQHLNNGTTYFGWPYVSSTNHTGGRSLYWYGSTTTGTYGDYQIVVLPGVDTNIYPINTLQLNFWARPSSTSYSPVFQVGVMSNPTDASTFQNVQTVNVQNVTTWQEFTVLFGNYTGSGQYIAVRMNRPSSSLYAYTDDFTLSVAPSCAPVVSHHVTATASSARITWTRDPGFATDPDGYNVSYSFASNTASATTVSTTDPELTLTGLDPDSAYTVTINSDCGDSYSPDYTFNFTTMALPCIEWDTTGNVAAGPTDTLTVGTPGTSTTAVMPVNNDYNYSYTQHLILPSHVSLTGATTISGIAFDYAYSQPMTHATNCQIYMGNTTRSTFTVSSPADSAFVPYSDLTLVYQGPLNCTTNGYNYFQFNQGVFQYDGTSNIVVAIVNNSGSYDGTSYVFRYETTSATTGGAMTHRVYNNTTPYGPTEMNAARANQSFWRTNMKLVTGGGGDCLTQATCVAPAVSIEQENTGNYLLSWVPGYQETSWDVDYRVTGTATWTNVVSGTSNTDYTFLSTDLQSNTHYEFRVTALCSDTNIATTLAYTTPCGMIDAVPFTENFDTYGAGTTVFPSCWYKLGSTADRPYINSSTTYGHNNTYGLYFYAVATGYCYAIMPRVNTTILNLNTLQVSFWARQYSTSYNCDFEVGVMTDPTNASTFTAISSVHPAGTTYESFEVPLSSYTGTGSYIAFRAIQHPGSSTAIYMMLDDVTLENAPSCPRVTNVQADNITQNDATISWTATNANEYEVQYGPAGFTLGTGAIEIGITDDSVALTGLTANTPYDVYVRGICTDDTSNWSFVYTFRTACGILDSLPFTEDFENQPTGTSSTGSPFIPCWTRLNNGTSYPGYPYVSSSSTYNHTQGGTKGLYWYGSTTTGTYGDYQYIILPQIDTTVYPINTLQLGFWAKASSTSYHPVLQVGVMNSTTDTAMTVLATINVNPGSSTEWGEFITSLSEYTGSGSYVAIRALRPSSTWYVYVDDITLELLPPCPRVEELHAINATLDSITIVWTDTSSTNTSWVVEYDTVDFTPGDDNSNATSITVTDTIYNLSGLDSAHTYHIYVYPICDDYIGYRHITAATLAASPATVPYTCDFEENGPNGWDFLNDGQTNYWMVGTDAHNGGTQSMYITNNGTSNAYNTSTISYSYAIRTFNLSEPGEYAYSYDWKGTGESHYYDFTRVFVTPASEMFTAGDVLGGSTYAFSTAAAPASWIELTQSGETPNTLAQQSTWTTVTGTFTITTPGNYKMVFVWANDGSGGTQPPTAIDNVSLVQNVCPSVDDLNLAYVTIDSAIVTWNSFAEQTGYIFEYDSVPFTPGNATNVFALTDTFYVMTGLTAGMTYYVSVRAECTGDTALAATMHFTTLASLPATVPYSCDFEQPGVNGWDLIQAGQDNYWIVGNATNNGGTKSLYITDNGTANSYSGAASYSFAVRTFNLAAGNYVCTYDWKCQGESSFDFIRAALVPAGVNIEAGDYCGFDNASAMPAGSIALDGGYRLNLQGSSWQNQITEFTLTSAGTYKIVFLWRNDGSVYNVPPAAIDNVQLMLNLCPMPQNITLTNLTQTSADVSWEEPGNATTWEYQLDNNTPVIAYDTFCTLTGLTANTVYSFHVRSICGQGDTGAWTTYNFRTPCGYMTLPYTEDFENETAGSSTTGSVFVNCWNRLNNGTSYGGYPYVGSSSTYNHTSGGGKGLYWYNTTTTGTYGDYLCAVLPPVDPNVGVDSLQLSFWAKASSASYTPIFQIGVMTDPNNISTFVGVDTVTITSGTSWMQVEVPLTTYTGNGQYVAVKVDRASAWTAYTDDFTLEYTPTCLNPRNVISTDASSTSITIDWTDLDQPTSWEIRYVQNGVTNSIFTNSHPYTVTGLEALTAYHFEVRAICGAGDTSTWSMEVALSTAMCDNAVVVMNYDSTLTSGTSTYSPIGYSFYNYGYTQVIIDSAYLVDLTGEINALAFEPTVTTAGDKYQNMTVYLANVPEDNLTSGWILPDSTDHVFVKVIDNGDFCYSTTGQKIQGFDTTFTWDGHSNILVSVVRNNGSYTSGATFAAHTHSVAKARYVYRDSPGGYNYLSPEAAGTAITTVGDLYLISCGAGCAKPSLLPVTDLSYNGATLNWNSNATDFEVAVKAATDAEYPEPTAVSNATSYAVSGLAPATLYRFHVRAVCDATENLVSDWIEGSFVTDSLPCFDPTELAVQSTGYTTATLGWTANGEESAWRIRVWNTTFDETYDVTSNPATVTGLVSDVEYSAEVMAVCGGILESGVSNTVTFRTARCEAPTNVSTSNITAHTAVVNWNGDASSYRVEYGTEGFGTGEGTSITATGTTVTLTGLLDDQTYDVYVYAVCAEGLESAASQKHTFETTIEGIDIAGGMNVSIYPNPTTSATTIALSGVNGEVSITIVDMNGRIVMSDSMSCEGDCTKTMEVSGLAQGAYFVRLNGDNVNMVKKLVVK